MPKEATTVLFSAEERVLVDTDFISLVSCEHAQLDLGGAGTAFSSRCGVAQICTQTVMLHVGQYHSRC